MSGLALSEKDITVICSNTEKKDIAKILTEVASIHESYAPLEIINHSDYQQSIPAGKDNTTAAIYTPEEMIDKENFKWKRF